MTDYEMPQGCLRNRDELQALVADGKPFSATWDGKYLCTATPTPKTIMGENTVGQLATVYVDKGQIELAFTPNKYHYHLFPNYWFAYAFYLKVRASK